MIGKAGLAATSCPCRLSDHNGSPRPDGVGALLTHSGRFMQKNAAPRGRPISSIVFSDLGLSNPFTRAKPGPARPRSRMATVLRRLRSINDETVPMKHKITSEILVDPTRFRPKRRTDAEIVMALIPAIEAAVEKILVRGFDTAHSCRALKEFMLDWETKPNTALP